MSSNKLLLNGILVFSILSLSIAYFIQYVLGHKPCNLCIIERIPYIAAIILISLVFILNRYQKIISSIILIFFIFGSVVSFYHFGIEQGFFEESTVCGLKNISDLITKEGLEDFITLKGWVVGEKKMLAINTMITMPILTILRLFILFKKIFLKCALCCVPLVYLQFCNTQFALLVH